MHDPHHPLTSNNHDHDSLPRLRHEMAGLDRQILALVGRRLETSRLIGEAKVRANLPIRDFRVEVDVMSRARRLAEEFKIDPQVAEQVMETLIKAAVQTQIEQQSRTPQGQKRILIVGGCGRMGRWLERFLAAQGHAVFLCDPAISEDDPGHYATLDLAANQPWDVVVLSTPLGMLPQSLEHAVGLPGNPLIFDIGSLKSQLSVQLRKHASQGRRVTSLHPMFASETVLLQGRTLLVCDAGHADATEEAQELFRGTAISLYQIPLEEHDRYMAALLGLSHAINLLFGAALRRLGLPFSALGQVASTTFAKQARTAAEVAAENPELYHEIQHLNPFSAQVYEHMETALGQLKQAALSGEAKSFLDFMGNNHDYFFP